MSLFGQIQKRRVLKTTPPLLVLTLYLKLFIIKFLPFSISSVKIRSSPTYLTACRYRLYNSCESLPIANCPFSLVLKSTAWAAWSNSGYRYRRCCPQFLLTFQQPRKICEGIFNISSNRSSQERNRICQSLILTM